MDLIATGTRTLWLSTRSRDVRTRPLVWHRALAQSCNWLTLFTAIWYYPELLSWRFHFQHLFCYFNFLADRFFKFGLLGWLAILFFTHFIFFFNFLFNLFSSFSIGNKIINFDFDCYLHNTIFSLFFPEIFRERKWESFSQKNCISWYKCSVDVIVIVKFIDLF